MADIDDLDYKSILNMGDDEAVESLRQIRLRRVTPTKSKKVVAKPKKPANVQVDAVTAARLLEILGEGGDK